MQRTFTNEEADLAVDELLHPVTLAGHQAQHRQERLDVAQPPLLVLQLLLLCRLVDTGEHVGLGIAEHVEERLILGSVPQFLGGTVAGQAEAGRGPPGSWEVGGGWPQSGGPPAGH